MRRVLATITSIVWALWLGGLVTIFILVTMMFRADRPTALQAAPRMFVVFGKYQLILSAIGLISTFFWRLAVRGGS